MPADISKIYQFRRLDAYSFKERTLIRLAELGLYFLVRTIGKTLRYEVDGWENYQAIVDNGKLPIYSFWHEGIFAGTYYFRGRRIVVMNSKSLDGEYMSRFVIRLGYGSIRGSSTRGGTGALVEMIRAMRAGSAAAFTVDGPRGPRHEAKMGPVLLAKKTGNPMMPFTVVCHRSWRLRSWDRLHIPKPLSRVRLIIAPPIYVDASSNDTELERNRIELQQALEELSLEGKQWQDEC